MFKKIKEKLKRFWKWIVAGIIGGIAIAQVSAPIIPPDIPLEDQLKTTPDKIIDVQEDANEVTYVYISDEVAPPEAGEELELRTESAKFFPKGNIKKNKKKLQLWTARVYPGPIFYKEVLGNGSYRWLKIKSATTTPDAFRKQTAENRLPEWILGTAFAVSTTTYASTSDANFTSGTCGSWAACVSLASASSFNATELSSAMNVWTNGSQYQIDRQYMPFDTSFLTAQATIASSTFYGYFVAACVDGNNDGADIIGLLKAHFATAASSTNDDFDQFDADRLSDTTAEHDLTYMCSNLNNYYNFDLNATGTAAISKTGWTEFGLRQGHDFINVTPTAQDYITIQTAEGANPPYMDIDYTVPAASETKSIIPGMIK